jgi:hypothetical protein
MPRPGYAYGWKPTPPERPRVRLARALRAEAAPPAADFYTGLPAIGMHLNDRWGDCVWAADANIVQQQTYFGQGAEVQIPDGEVLRGYETTGFNPNAGPPGSNPTDNGTVIADGLSYLMKTGMSSHVIAGYGEVPVRDHGKVKVAVAEFGAVSIGISLPNSALDQFDAGQDWDVVADDGGIDGGHCVLVCGYDATGYDLWTWDRRIRMTEAFWDRYVEEAWAVISHDWVSAVTGRDPEGVDVATLGAEFAAVTGTNPFPPPAPVPTPPGADPRDVALASVTVPWTRLTRTRPDLAELKRALVGWQKARGFQP